MSHWTNLFLAHYFPTFQTLDSTTCYEQAFSMETCCKIWNDFSSRLDWEPNELGGNLCGELHNWRQRQNLRWEVWTFHCWSKRIVQSNKHLVYILRLGKLWYWVEMQSASYRLCPVKGFFKVIFYSWEDRSLQELMGESVAEAVTEICQFSLPWC